MTDSVPTPRRRPAKPLSLTELPRWIRTQERRVTELEMDMQFLKNLLVLSPYGVRVPRDALRDPRVFRRPRQGGHL